MRPTPHSRKRWTRKSLTVMAARIPERWRECEAIQHDSFHALGYVSGRFHDRRRPFRLYFLQTHAPYLPAMRLFPFEALRAKACESVFEIGDEIDRVFKTDVQTQGWALCAPLRHAAKAPGIGRNDQALETAPTPAHPEQAHAVQHRDDSLMRHRAQHDAEESGPSAEIALPQIVTPRAW